MLVILPKYTLGGLYDLPRSLISIYGIVVRGRKRWQMNSPIELNLKYKIHFWPSLYFCPLGHYSLSAIINKLLWEPQRWASKRGGHFFGEVLKKYIKIGKKPPRRPRRVFKTNSIRKNFRNHAILYIIYYIRVVNIARTFSITTCEWEKREKLVEIWILENLPL